MGETRKLAAILVADVVGYSRLTGANEDRILARLRTLRSDLIDPTIAVHHGRVVKRTGDRAIVEFRSVVDAVSFAIEIQRAMVERNAEVTPDKRIEFRVGVHVGDVVEESDGDLMGDGVNIAARLQSVAKPGTICLSEQAYWQVKGRLDLKVTDLGATQLKNIAEPIHVYLLEVDYRAQVKKAVSPHPPTKSAPPRLSLVVLPFTNISGDPDQDYFVDGVTESLTTDLSRMAGALVIGRSTAFTYKGKAVDLRQIGRELNVRYVLQGSVQRSGRHIRVNVQLIESEAGRHLWADRFDKPVSGLFEMQDEIVSRLANRLRTELVDAEARRAQQARHPDAVDLIFQGWAVINRGFSPEILAKARRFFERALELDPENIDALVGIANVDFNLGVGQLTDDPRSLLASAEMNLSRALAVAPNHVSAHSIMGMVLCVTDRAARGIGELERALVINPNIAHARAWLGFAHLYIGQAEETEAHVTEALRLSPLDALEAGKVRD